MKLALRLWWWPCEKYYDFSYSFQSMRKGVTGILWQSWSNMTCDSNCEFCRMDTYSYWKSASQIYCCKMKSRFFLKQPFSCNMKYWIQNNVCFFLIFLIFSSPEPKVQVSLSNHTLSVVRLSVCELFKLLFS